MKFNNLPLKNGKAFLDKNRSIAMSSEKKSSAAQFPFADLQRETEVSF